MFLLINFSYLSVSRKDAHYDKSMAITSARHPNVAATEPCVCDKFSCFIFGDTQIQRCRYLSPVEHPFGSNGFY